MLKGGKRWDKTSLCVSAKYYGECFVGGYGGRNKKRVGSTGISAICVPTPLYFKPFRETAFRFPLTTRYKRDRGV